MLSSLELVGKLLFLMLSEKVFDELFDFHDGDDRNGKGEGDAVFCPADGSKAESVYKERDLDDRCGQKERADEGTPENDILRFQGEDRMIARAHIEGMEDLGH